MSGRFVTEQDIKELCKDVKIMAVTFNMGNVQGENFESLFDEAKQTRDIIVIGLQESTFSAKEDKSITKLASIKSSFEPCVAQLNVLFDNALGKEFSLVSHV